MEDAKFVVDDGGRAAAGYKGHAGDCVCRAIVIASGRPYQEVYDALAAGNAGQRKSKRGSKKTGVKTAAHGINVKRDWFKKYMASLGFEWVSTMSIGSGCKVHLVSNELPKGRLVVSVSKHYTCMIDGVIRDTWNPERTEIIYTEYVGQEIGPDEYLSGDEKYVCRVEHRRCVYGYWILRK